jgi:FKBP-type peptidyl-prolyl cis-trans isomerase FkpA
MKLLPIAILVMLHMNINAQESIDTTKIFPDGTPYQVRKVAHDPTDTQKIALGKYIQVYYIQKLKGSNKPDTTLRDSYETGVQGVEIVPEMFDTTNPQIKKAPVFNVLLGLQVGDSLFIKASVAEIVKEAPEAEELLGNKGILEISYKIHKIYNNTKDYLTATKKEKQAALETYVQKNNMNEYFKEKDSIYVIPISPQMPGAPKITKGTKVKVNYTGYFLNGKIFDSNVDDVPGKASRPEQKQPLEFEVGAQQMIPGFDAAMKYIGKGGKATIILPYNRGYGEMGILGDIGPYETLVYDVEIVDAIYKEANTLPKVKTPIKKTTSASQKKKFNTIKTKHK